MIIISLLLVIPREAFTIGPYSSANMREMLFSWAHEERSEGSDFRMYFQDCVGAICTYTVNPLRFVVYQGEHEVIYPEKEKEDE